MKTNIKTNKTANSPHLDAQTPKSVGEINGYSIIYKRRNKRN